MGVAPGQILQVLPEGGIARILSCNSDASPTPASFTAQVQKQYLSVLQASHSVSGTRDRILVHFVHFLVSSAHISSIYPDSTSPWSGSYQAKEMLELEKSTTFSSPGGSATAEELGHATVLTGLCLHMCTQSYSCFKTLNLQGFRVKGALVNTEQILSNKTVQFLKWHIHVDSVPRLAI